MASEVPEINLKHLMTLTDETGILQHAKYSVPDRIHGYCTDDNARALVVTLMAAGHLPYDSTLEALSSRYLSFLQHAFDKASGRFRNFMTYERRWRRQKGPEDTHGRAVWALGVAAASGRNEGQINLSVELCQRSLPALGELVSPRSWAFGLAGIHSYLKKLPDDSEAGQAFQILAERLYGHFSKNAKEDWPWPEERLSYANAKLPYALLLSGRALNRPEMTEMGLRVLDWLARIQTGANDCFSPVGTKGWYRRGGKKARFDQQPIEAQAMVEACIEAHGVTEDERWLAEARRCFEWFLGRNDLGLPLCDPVTGGCRDGLHRDRVNENQGAESTLVWLLALLTMHEQRRAGDTARGARATGDSASSIPRGNAEAR